VIVKLPAPEGRGFPEEVSFILCPSTLPIPLRRDGARSGQGKNGGVRYGHFACGD